MLATQAVFYSPLYTNALISQLLQIDFSHQSHPEKPTDISESISKKPHLIYNSVRFADYTINRIDKNISLEYNIIDGMFIFDIFHKMHYGLSQTALSNQVNTQNIYFFFLLEWRVDPPSAELIQSFWILLACSANPSLIFWEPWFYFQTQ